MGAFVKNVFDTTHINYTIESLTGQRNINASETDPRTYGMNVGVRF